MPVSVGKQGADEAHKGRYHYEACHRHYGKCVSDVTFTYGFDACKDHEAGYDESRDGQYRIPETFISVVVHLLFLLLCNQYITYFRK